MPPPPHTSYGGGGIIENNFHLYDGGKRMKRNAGFLVGLVAEVMVLVGCATTREDLGRFTIISSKNIDLSRLSEMRKATHNPLLGDTRERISQTSNKQLNAKFMF